MELQGPGRWDQVGEVGVFGSASAAVTICSNQDDTGENGSRGHFRMGPEPKGVGLAGLGWASSRCRVA